MASVPRNEDRENPRSFCHPTMKLEDFFFILQTTKKSNLLIEIVWHEWCFMSIILFLFNWNNNKTTNLKQKKSLEDVFIWFLSIFLLLQTNDAKCTGQMILFLAMENLLHVLHLKAKPCLHVKQNRNEKLAIPNFHVA